MPDIDHPIFVGGTQISPNDDAEVYRRKLARIALDEMVQLVAVLSTNGTLLECNRAALRAGDVASDEIYGKPLWESFWWTASPETKERLREAVTRAAAGEFVRFDLQIYERGSGRENTVIDFTLRPVRDEQGKVIYLLAEGRDTTRSASTHDLSGRNEAEEAQRRLAAIVESSDDAIASKDLNGIVTSWNKSAERLFGYKPEEIIGQPITLVIPPELHGDEAIILSKLRRGEKIDHFETVRVRKDGERIDVSLTISPVRDEHGMVVGAAKIVRDITESKKIERALRTTEKLAAAGRLAATVAHEINNPLEAVTNLVYLARRDLKDTARVSGYLELARRELDRVAHIARQTLGFYRDTSSPGTVNISNTLDDLLLLYQKKFEMRQIHVEKCYDPGLKIIGLAGEIRQALSNLITNAIDAMPAGGTLILKASNSHSWDGRCPPGVRITILDTGSGIAPKDKKNLFHPFFTTKTDVGTGLGLWITRTIVERHGGTIRVKSRTGPQEHGTAFSLFFPAEGYVATPDINAALNEIDKSALSTGAVNK